MQLVKWCKVIWNDRKAPTLSLTSAQLLWELSLLRHSVPFEELLRLLSLSQPPAFVDLPSSVASQPPEALEPLVFWVFLSPQAMSSSLATRVSKQTLCNRTVLLWHSFGTTTTVGFDLGDMYSSGSLWSKKKSHWSVIENLKLRSSSPETSLVLQLHDGDRISDAQIEFFTDAHLQVLSISRDFRVLLNWSHSSKPFPAPENLPLQVASGVWRGVAERWRRAAQRWDVPTQGLRLNFYIFQS